MYYNSTINKYKNMPKELWKLINSVIPNKHLKRLSIPKLINDGLVTDKLTEISEQFNNYFVKIGMTIASNVNKSDDSDFKTYLKHSISSTIVVDPPQRVEIFNVINSSNHHKDKDKDSFISLHSYGIYTIIVNKNKSKFIVQQRNITQYRKRKIKFTMNAIGKLRSDRLRVFESSNHPCFKKKKKNKEKYVYIYI